MAGLAIRFAIPSVVWLSAWLSSALTAEPMSSSTEKLAGLQIGMPNWDSIPMLERPSAAASWLSAHDSEWWASYLSALSEHALWLSAAFLLDAVVFPILSLMLVWWMFKRLALWLAGGIIQPPAKGAGEGPG